MSLLVGVVTLIFIDVHGDAAVPKSFSFFVRLLALGRGPGGVHIRVAVATNVECKWHTRFRFARFALLVPRNRSHPTTTTTSPPPHF